MVMLRAEIEQWRGDRAAAGARRHRLGTMRGGDRAAIGMGGDWVAVVASERHRALSGAAIGATALSGGDWLGERAVIGRRAPIGLFGDRWSMCSAAIGVRWR
jgi:hypothetical protein